MTGKETKKTKVINLLKEINRSKEDIIDYLKSIGVEKVTVNSQLEPEIVEKVKNHFLSSIQQKEKHLKKIVDFSKNYNVKFDEAEKKKKQDEEERKKREEELKLKKIIEEERKKEEEEKKKQELLAFLEREKIIKAADEEEKKKKAQLEKLYEENKKRQEEKERKLAEKIEKKKESETAKTQEIKKEKVEKVISTNKIIPEKPKEEVNPIEVPKSVPESGKKEPVIITGKEKISAKDTKEPIKQEKTESGQGALKTGFVKTQRTGFESSGKDKISKKPVFPRKKEFQNRDNAQSGFAKDKQSTVKDRYKKVTIKDNKLLKKADERQLREKEKLQRKETTVDDKNKIIEIVDKIITPPIVPGKKSEKWAKEKKSREYEESKKKKSLKGYKQKEFTQEEIDEAIRSTLAKPDDDTGTTARSIAKKRKKKERIEQEKKIQEIKDASKNVIKVTEFLSTGELANLMNIEPTELIKKCYDLGMMVSINQRLEKDLIVLLAEEFGYKIEFQDEYKEEVETEETESPENLVPRPPVVTVMGHVDHGKTSLLDYIRKENVVAGEHGGITQHIGAYKVYLDGGKEITFLDTPGHEAFTAMRARGGQAADIVVLVVAADDSVMPQTVEAINHALAANVPIIIAINKIDKPDSNINKIKQQLADKNVLIEEWGGKYQCVEISAKFGKNIDLLLEKILLEAELLELKANPNRLAKGIILESKLDKGKGIVATVLVQKGTLKIGDNFLAGIYSGRVKAMFDERDKKIETAGPSTPVQVLGFDGQPQAGDSIVVMKSESEVKSIALKRQQLKREQDLRQVKFTTLDDIAEQIRTGQKVELNIILKTDVDGTIAALADSLHKLTTDEAKVNVIHKAVGQITESDVLLAEASKAIIIGFNVRPNLNARKLAEKNNVDIRIYNIIYKAIDEIKQALEGMLAPEVKDEVTATVEVRNIFKVPKIGNVAGCYVQDGKISRNNKVRLLREGLEIYNGTIASLKRIKDDVREVEAGYECGICLENFGDIKVGDVIESYKIVETKRKLINA